MRGLFQTVGAWIVLPATSKSTLQPTAVTFKELLPLKKSKSKKRNANENVSVNGVLPPNGVLSLASSEEGEDNDDDDEEEEEEKKEEDEQDLPPLYMFFGIEAMQPQEHHVANLVVAETEDDPRPFRLPGDQCVKDFLEWLDTLTLNDTRRVNVIAHNF